MDFIDEIQALAARVSKQAGIIETEEATKNAFVMPFISTLGYDVFNPTEVVPEYTADVGTRRGEKVDYAVMIGGKPMMLFECKWCGGDLDETHTSQLYRYFSVTEARIGILTNGIVYQFYSDLDAPNKMDSRPFLVIDLLDIQEPLVAELKKLTKSAFDLEEILSTASDLKYTRGIKRILAQEFSSPSEDFVKFLASQVYSGRMTQAVREQFTDITSRATSQFISESIDKRLKSALSTPSPSEPSDQEDDHDATTEEEQAEEEIRNRVVTTFEEIEGYHIVKALLRESVDPSRIVHRDTLSYFGILLDDNNRKPICRLHFNHETQRYITFFSEGKQPERVSITSLDDIYKHADKLKAIVAYYDQS